MVGELLNTNADLNDAFPDWPRIAQIHTKYIQRGRCQGVPRVGFATTIELSRAQQGTNLMIILCHQDKAERADQCIAVCAVPDRATAITVPGFLDQVVVVLRTHGKTSASSPTNR